MGNSIFAMITIGIGCKKLTETLMPAYMCNYGSFIFFHIAPNQRNVTAVNGMVKKLFGKIGIPQRDAAVITG